MTLRQLATVGQNKKTVSYPCCEIKDSPAFLWRGVMLDEARHFFGKAAVCDLLERMAQYKLNVFHWHLTDDQAWRIDIPEFPELARRGTRREGRCESEVPLYYTENDIKEILACAKARHIVGVWSMRFDDAKTYCSVGNIDLTFHYDPAKVRTGQRLVLYRWGGSAWVEVASGEASADRLFSVSGLSSFPQSENIGTFALVKKNVGFILMFK